MDRPPVASQGRAHRTDAGRHVEVGVSVRDGLVDPAHTDPVLVLEERADLRELVGVPLGLTGDGRADQSTFVVVVMFMGLDRLPPKEPLVADPEVSGEPQTLSEGGVVDDPLEKKGDRTTLSSCIATTSVTRSRRSA